MTETKNEPTSSANLDQYGSAAMPWSRVRDALVASSGADLTFFVGTVRPDGRPHSAGVGAMWTNDVLYFVSGPGTRRARNLAKNPACTVSTRLPGVDIVLEGEAYRVTDADTLERVASAYRDSGWPATVAGDAFTAPFTAPSAGPPPWHVHRLVLRTAFGVASAEPYGATRWDFSQ